MSTQTIYLNDQIYNYLLQHTLREPELLRSLRAYTAQTGYAHMQIAPEQGQFMALLVQMLNAQNILEIGVFTGYSSLAMALAMPANGRIVACDISEQWTTIAQSYWQQAGVVDHIDLRIAPAMQTLDKLLANGQHESFDFAFIDADKTNYPLYYERCLELIRSGGVIAVDNALWHGNVADPQSMDDDTQTIHQLNTKLQTDQRVDMSLVPIGDGLLLARKR